MHLFDLIETNSLSNIWFWLLLAVTWSTASHWVLGVPFDLVSRARREGGITEDRVLMILDVNLQRLSYIRRVAGALMIGMFSFFLTVFGILGFVYRFEFFQAMFLLAFPFVFVGLLSLRAAHILNQAEAYPRGEELYRFFRNHRLVVQFIGLVTIFFTSIWGMLVTITVSSFPW